MINKAAQRSVTYLGRKFEFLEFPPNIRTLKFQYVDYHENVPENATFIRHWRLDSLKGVYCEVISFQFPHLQFWKLPATSSLVPLGLTCSEQPLNENFNLPQFLRLRLLNWGSAYRPCVMSGAARIKYEEAIVEFWSNYNKADINYMKKYRNGEIIIAPHEYEINKPMSNLNHVLTTFIGQAPRHYDFPYGPTMYRDS
jgi:hypothetical protein